MIPHSAIVAASAGVLASVSWADQRVVYLAYLPLAHVLELAAEHAILTLGACIG
jgi:long-chain acyl-CoA synthetase